MHARARSPRGDRRESKSAWRSRELPCSHDRHQQPGTAHDHHGAKKSLVQAAGRSLLCHLRHSEVHSMTVSSNAMCEAGVRALTVVRPSEIESERAPAAVLDAGAGCRCSAASSLRLPPRLSADTARGQAYVIVAPRSISTTGRRSWPRTTAIGGTRPDSARP